MNTAFNTIVGRTLQDHVKHIRLSLCDLNSANPIATANRTLETAHSIDISLAQRQTENQYCKLIQIPASQSAVTDTYSGSQNFASSFLVTARHKQYNTTSPLDCHINTHRHRCICEAVDTRCIQNKYIKQIK